MLRVFNSSLSVSTTSVSGVFLDLLQQQPYIIKKALLISLSEFKEYIIMLHTQNLKEM